jgi:hypothetical protein
MTFPRIAHNDLSPGALIKPTRHEVPVAQYLLIDYHHWGGGTKLEIGNFEVVNCFSLD